MMTNDYQRRRSEIEQRIEYEKERCRVYPPACKSAQREIAVFEDILERLELEYRQAHPE